MGSREARQVAVAAEEPPGPPVLNFLASEPLALLFAVILVGTAIGKIEIHGFALGPAAVLFTGIAAAAWDHRLVLDETYQVFGLALFTYVIGLATGPSFVAGLRGRGLPSLAVVVAAVAASAAVAAGLAAALGQSATAGAGLFAGASTNTPALGAVIDGATNDYGPRAAVMYTLAYPGGVLCALAAAHVALRRARRATPPAPDPLVTWTIEVTRPVAVVPTVGQVVVSRHSRDGAVHAATGNLDCRPGDLITAVGPASAVAALADRVGVRSTADLPKDRGVVDFRRITVSSPAIVGRTLGELNLGGRFGATATRFRRGDVDMVATDGLTLEPGDRVRVVAPVGQLPAIARLFGDSENELSELNFVAVAAGILAGVALGAVTFPGGVSLGAAGGTLVTGLALGSLGRIGPLTFALGHQASYGLRQLGITLFLAAVGTRSGEAFAESAFTLDGATYVAAGAAVSATAMAVVLWTGRRVARLDDVSLAGGVAGAQTQPAVLAFAEGATGHDQRVAVAYTSLFPAAMVAKIVAAQILAAF